MNPQFANDSMTAKILKHGAFVVVFSDLDGTLLDHHTYRFDEAADALRRPRAWPLGT